jgi:hypothetical protein
MRALPLLNPIIAPCFHPSSCRTLSVSHSGSASAVKQRLSLREHPDLDSGKKEKTQGRSSWGSFCVLDSSWRSGLEPSYSSIWMVPQDIPGLFLKRRSVAWPENSTALRSKQVIQAGCNACVSKPIDFKSLARELERWLELSAKLPSSK